MDAPKRRRIAKLEYDGHGRIGVWYYSKCYHRERVNDWDVRGHVENHNISRGFERASQWAVSNGFDGSEIVNA